MTAINASTIQIGTSFTYSPLTSITVDDKDNLVQDNHQSKTSSTQVNISPQAREKLALEQSEQGPKLAQQLQTDNIEEEKNESDTEFLDKMIEKTQEQIKEIQRELRELNNDNSKEVQQERKMLESQLTSLNGTLLGLFGKKLAGLEESAP